MGNASEFIFAVAVFHGNYLCVEGINLLIHSEICLLKSSAGKSTSIFTPVWKLIENDFQGNGNEKIILGKDQAFSENLI